MEIRKLAAGLVTFVFVVPALAERQDDGTQLTVRADPRSGAPFRFMYMCCNKPGWFGARLAATGA